MATAPDNNEDFELLDEFVCQAIPCTPGPAVPASPGRAENEGLHVVKELIFDAGRNGGTRLTPPLQPLRVPTGWVVEFNNGLYEIDPSPELIPPEERWLLFKQDMLQMKHEHFNRLLDLGWRPEGDLDTGQYGVEVYEGDHRGKLLYQFATKDRSALVAEIERLLAAVCDRKL
jgi:hypothetical protein